MMTHTYTTPSDAALQAIDPRLICPDCTWQPPPAYRYGVNGQSNKAAWVRLYQEHRTLRLCPQYRAEQNQRYIRGMQRAPLPHLL